jgi:hypothetical protein
MVERGTVLVSTQLDLTSCFILQFNAMKIVLPLHAQRVYIILCCTDIKITVSACFYETLLILKLVPKSTSEFLFRFSFSHQFSPVYRCILKVALGTILEQQTGFRTICRVMGAAFIVPQQVL